jgi:predicted amidophosphoribosyltransferase
MDRLKALPTICKRKASSWAFRESLGKSPVRRSSEKRLFQRLLGEPLELLDLFYPPLCRLCRSPTHRILCPICIDQLSLPDIVSRCRHCFAPLDSQVQLCPICVRAPRLSAPSAYLFEQAQVAWRLQSVLAQGNEEALRRTAASLLIVLWHRLNWPMPDRILIVRPPQHRRALMEVAEEFARMMDRPLVDEFCFRWQAPFQWQLERCKDDLLENQTLLLIDWGGPHENLRQALRLLRCAFARSVHVLSIFKCDLL